MRNEQQPTVREGSRDETVYEHPAFGQIAASRVQGGANLYGSDFQHQHFVTIAIRRSDLHRGLSRDWHFGRDELVEVALSEAQWATFVSSMNMGSGTPCTIQYVNREPMPGIPARNQGDDFRAEVHKKATDAAKRVDAAIAEVEGEIGKSLSGVKRDKILDHLRRLRMDIGSNMPFVAQSFEEHMENTVERAKVEVNAYVLGAIQRAGMAALSDGATPPLALPQPTGRKEEG